MATADSTVDFQDADFPDALMRAADWLQGLAQNVPVDGIWPGFTTTAASRKQYHRAVGLVNQAVALAERLIARETPRAEPYYQAFNLEEQRELAKKRAKRIPKP